MKIKIVPPTWKGILPGLIAVLTNSKDSEGIKIVTEELQNMAELADSVNGNQYILDKDEYEKVKHLLTDKN